MSVQRISFHPEMALFPMSPPEADSRGFSACDVPQYASAETLVSASGGLIEKVAHFQIGNAFVLSFKKKLFSDGHELAICSQ
jgi:hypothetical protein